MSSKWNDNCSFSFPCLGEERTGPKDEAVATEAELEDGSQPRNAGRHQKLEEAGNRFSLQREHSPANTLSLDLWPHGTVR